MSYVAGAIWIAIVNELGILGGEYLFFSSLL